MKFLTKSNDSAILKNNLTYKKSQTDKNRELKEELLKEQHNFCAYTEKYIQPLDATEVEHFNSSLKYNDDYFNYYAVLRKANQYKIEKDNKYKDASFFKSLFFQDEKEFNKRIVYEDGFYSEIDENDREAKDLIDFLGFNHELLSNERSRCIRRLKNTFENAGYNNDEIKEYFSAHIEDLSFITAVEIEFSIDLSELIC